MVSRNLIKPRSAEICIHCRDKQRLSKATRATYLLRQAQAVVETDLDSALIYIDSLTPIAGDLNKTQHWEYIITKTQAKYKNYEDVTQDTAIFEARKYFADKNDYKQRTLAHLYSGCVYRELGEYEPAMFAYKEAFDAAILANDTLLMGRTMYCIGALFYKQGLHRDALTAYKKAVNISESLPYNQATYYGCVGRCYALMFEKDSAIYFYEKSINLAEKVGDKSLQG